MRTHRLALFCLAAAIAVGLAPSGARGEARVDEQTKQVDATLASIESLVTAIEATRDEAAARGQALRVSCLDAIRKIALGNRAAARSIRKLWSPGLDDAEYRERSLTRLLRLQVYSMVFENEARSCTDAGGVRNALEVVVPGGRLSAAPGNVGDPTVTAPAAPVLERPPLASPY